MDFPQLADLPVVDAHIHYGHPAYVSGLMYVFSHLCVDRFNVVCTPHQTRLSLAPGVLPVLSGCYRRERRRQGDTMRGCQ
ncbi:MAG: hypothetical protein U9R15_20925 [Chloroflexota bacterium]|nr:hypothetical protein [Chloroflexota bacterium]